MSRPFAAVESFLERILERPAARLFHAHPQPVQLERRIERAMTAQRMERGGRTYVPSKYRIVLNPSDFSALQAASDRLPADLADAILQRARSQGYWFVSRPEVVLVPSTRITQGDLEVDAEPLDPTLVSSAAAGLRPVGLEGPRPPKPPIPGTGVVPDPSPESLPPLPPLVVSTGYAGDWSPMEATLPPADLPAPPPAPAVSAGPLAAAAAAPADPPAQAAATILPARPPGSAEASLPPEPPASVVTDLPAEPAEEDLVQATIDIAIPGEASRGVAFRGGMVRVGRGTDNDIVLRDERVSRHHGQFTSRHGVMVYTDLDSTNGSLVNGARVREAGLGVGDTVRLGRATLTILPPT